MKTATVTKSMICDGLRAQKIDMVLRSYMLRQVDLRDAAAMAGVSYNRFLREVQAHNILVLAEDGFLDRMAVLAEVVNDDSLRIAVEKASTQAAARSVATVDQS